MRILDDRTLLLPDRPGNRLADSFRNVLENPHVALLFIVPGVTDTFRVNGRATIVTDPELLEPCAVEGKVPKLGLRIEIEEAFTHCSKAFLRANLWDPERYVDARRAALAGRAPPVGRRRGRARDVRRRAGRAVRAARRLLLIRTGSSTARYSLDRGRGGAGGLPRRARSRRGVPRDRRALRPVDRGPGAAPAAADADAFAAAAGRAGIGDGVFVVAYDHGAAGGAARLWWLLRHFGHEDVAVLRGGFDAWLGPVRGGEEEIEPREFVPRVRAAATRSTRRSSRRGSASRGWSSSTRAPRSATAARSSRSTRSPGRIPGAVNWPYAEAGELPPEIADADEIVVYCGSGITACVDLLALAQAGRPDAKLYPGSWSDWCGRGLPVERG